MVADVTRRASLLWPGKTKQALRPSRTERNRLGNHAALASVDSVDVVPLDNIPASPTLSATSSPGGSPKGPNSPVNPFSHPSDLGDPNDQQPALMDESSNPPTPPSQAEKRKDVSHPKRPTLTVSTSSFKNPPPPKPLGLPPPRTPPPQITSSPLPIVSPSLAEASQELEEPKETRWWHDWCCGLTEGSDRGGDNQVDTVFF